MKSARTNYIHFTSTSQLGKFPTGGNFIAFSELGHFHAPMVRRDVVGLKYVLEGEENYVVNGVRHKVKPGQLLVVDDLEYGEAFNLKNSASTVGLCVNLERSLIDEVIGSQIFADTDQLDNPSPAGYFNFFERSAPAAQLAIGKQLNYMLTGIVKDPDANNSAEKNVFYSLAESLVSSHGQLQLLRSKVKASKSSTRQEMIRRLMLARDFILDCPGQNILVEDLAQAAGMSEYYFGRSFKEVFGKSPYQFLLEQRLKRSATMIREGIYSVTEIAWSCGFSDIHAFSKAFKKYYNSAPSAFGRI